MLSHLNVTSDLVASGIGRRATPLPISGRKEHRSSQASGSGNPRGVRPIAYQPGIGRPVESMEPECREWFIDFGDSGYIVLYRHDGQAAVILAVRHQREVGY